MTAQTLLVILAHPDDESFPMGGTLAKAAAKGKRVQLIYSLASPAKTVHKLRSILHVHNHRKTHAF